MSIAGIVLELHAPDETENATRNSASSRGILGVGIVYEAFGEGLLPLLWVWFRYPRRLPPGRLAGEFLLLYAAARIMSECFRSAEDGYILGLTAGQFWTLPFVVLGSILVFRTRRSVE